MVHDVSVIQAGRNRWPANPYSQHQIDRRRRLEATGRLGAKSSPIQPSPYCQASRAAASIICSIRERMARHRA